MVGNGKGREGERRQEEEDEDDDDDDEPTDKSKYRVKVYSERHGACQVSTLSPSPGLLSSPQNLVFPPISPKTLDVSPLSLAELQSISSK